MKKFVSFVLVLCMAISLFAITAAACNNCTNDSYLYRGVGAVKGTYVNLRACHKTTSSTVINAGLNSGDQVSISRAYVPSNGYAWYYITVQSCSTNSSYIGKSGWLRSDLINIDYGYEEMKIVESGEYN